MSKKITQKEKEEKRQRNLRKQNELYTSVRIRKTTLNAMQSVRNGKPWDNFFLDLANNYDESASPAIEVIQLEVEKALNVIFNKHKK